MSDDQLPTTIPGMSTRPPRSPAPKAEWQPPKLTFVEPKLTKEGDVGQITGQGFFGTFVP